MTATMPAPVDWDPADLERMLERPTFLCAIDNGDDERLAEIVAYSTADAFATYLERIPSDFGRRHFARSARELHRRDRDAQLAHDAGRGRERLTVSRAIGREHARLFTAYVLHEM